MNIIILGATSNICSIRVFGNWTTNEFLVNHFYEKVKLKSIDNITNKIIYICGSYNLDSYNLVLSDKINDNTIIYVATPYLIIKLFVPI